MSKEKGLRVVLHIYEPAKGGLSLPGFGVYHTGIEIGDARVEHCYAGGPGVSGPGIQTQQPAVSPDPEVWRFKESVELGRTMKTAKEVSTMLSEMAKDWPAADYDVVHNNCNHFTQAVVDKLNASIKPTDQSTYPPLKYPAHINRAARFGSFFMDNPIADRKRKMTKKEEEEEKKKNPFLNSKGYSLGGQSTNQSTSQSTSRPATSQTAKTINQTGAAVPTTSPAPSASAMKQSINQSTSQPTSQPINQPSGPRKNPWADEKFVQQRLGKK